MMFAYQRSCFVGLIASALLLVAGCGDTSSPGEDVPAIASALTKVDDAIVDGRFDLARARLDELVATTTSAREAGDLDASEAEQILAAAAGLLSALPQDEEVPNPDDALTEDDVAVEEVPDDEEDSEEADDDEREREKEQKKREREQKKENKGRGNG